VVTQELLDELWDFDDPAGSYQRFADEAARPSHTAAERAELVTQQARALGLQGRFENGHALLGSLGDPADETDAAVRTRVALETGRLLNSADRVAEALPQFETAARIAETGGLEFLRIDALHMLAIADKDQSGAWAAQAIDLALTAPDDRTQRWLVSLYNNLGWKHFDAGSLQDAQTAFRQAQDWADRVGTQQQQVWAREATEECAAALAQAEAGA
jgi:tetratricopeptide (TPR) repeat protein